MGKHRRHDEEDNEPQWPVDDPDEEPRLKAQLASRTPPGEGIGEASLSPIETF